MKKDLQSYIKINYRMIEPDVCTKTISELQNVEWTRHEYTSNLDYTSQSLNDSKELDISCDHISTSDYIKDKVWHSYLYYIQELNFPWFNCWKGFTSVRFNRYKQGQIMSVHCDHINSMFDGERKGVPTMTALGCLNENYAGGELVMFEDSIIKMNAGDIMIFPSNFLYPHKVLPVTSGIRYSFVCWAW